MNFSVNVNVAKLLGIVQENRAKHKSIYDEAVIQYRLAFIRNLEDKIVNAKAGREISHRIDLPVPEQHLEAYDTLINMLSLTEDESVVLDQGEFEQYVEDNWGWQRSFFANTSSYSNKA